MTQKFYEGQNSRSVNTIDLSPAQLFNSIYRCFLTPTAELDRCAKAAENICYLAFAEKFCGLLVLRAGPCPT